MTNRAQFERRLKIFRAFVVARGAEMLVNTNQWELMRFRAGGETAIVYTNAKGVLSMIGEAKKAWDAFRSGHSWSAGVAQPRRKLSPFLATLIRRDGKTCFYCLQPTTDENRTVEHLVALAHGGPNHISNMVIACEPCNIAAGHLSAMEKIKIRERNMAKETGGLTT